MVGVLAFFLGFRVKVPCGRCTPGCRTRTPRRPPRERDPGQRAAEDGTYGFIRFSLPLLPDASRNPTIVNVMAVLSIIAIVYGALVSLMQTDWKKLVAYSSVSHLGLCTLGIFALNRRASRARFSSRSTTASPPACSS